MNLAVSIYNVELWLLLHFSFSFWQIYSISHLNVTQCSQCLGMTLLPVRCQPPLCNRLISLFPCGLAHYVPCVANTRWDCAALYSLLMLFVSLKALQGLVLAAHVRERHLSYLSMGKWCVVFIHTCRSCCSWHRQQAMWWLRCSRMGFIWVCMATTVFPNSRFPYVFHQSKEKKTTEFHYDEKPMMRCRGWIMSHREQLVK